MPAVLVEPAFISCKSDPDRTLLRTDEGLDKIAEAIVVGIVD
jgi:N-acetylmuramoyl-L-alanine amidase